jgi:tetratricopeptide (TPR) repeat protein
VAGASDIIQRVLARNERGAQPVALCVEGERLLVSRDLEAGLACFDRALQLDPTLARALTGRATVLMGMGDAAESLVCIDRALRSEPGFGPALALKGDILRKRGLREEALACYQDALTNRPELHEAWLARAAVLYELRRMKDAKHACERFLALATEDHAEYLTARMMLTELERAAGRPSIPPLPREEPLSPRPTKVAAKADKRSIRGASRKSVRNLDPKPLDPEPLDPKPLIHEKRKSVRVSRKPSGKISGSAHAAVRVKNTDQGDVTAEDLAVFDEVRALCLASRTVEALRKLEPVVKRCPEAAEAWVLRTHILVTLNQHEAALTSAERAARLDANDVETAKVLVKILIAMKKDDRVLAAAERVLVLTPRDPEAHRARGDCLVVLMRQAEAVFAYEKVIHYLPNDAAAWLALGRTLRQLRRFAEARMALTKALSLAKAHAPELVAQTNEFIAKLPPEG